MGSIKFYNFIHKFIYINFFYFLLKIKIINIFESNPNIIL